MILDIRFTNLDSYIRQVFAVMKTRLTSPGTVAWPFIFTIAVGGLLIYEITSIETRKDLYQALILGAIFILILRGSLKIVMLSFDEDSFYMRRLGKETQIPFSSITSIKRNPFSFQEGSNFSFAYRLRYLDEQMNKKSYTFYVSMANNEWLRLKEKLYAKGILVEE